MPASPPAWLVRGLAAISLHVFGHNTAARALYEKLGFIKTGKLKVIATINALRAVAEDTTTSSLLGIDTDRLILLTFVISGFLGGVTGTLIGLSVGIAGPYFGIAFGLKGLAVIVLGGLGDIPGAVVGGLVIGLAESFVPAQYIAYREAVPFALAANPPALSFTSTRASLPAASSATPPSTSGRSPTLAAASSSAASTFSATPWAPC